jgi:hypothetical protein
MIKNTICAEITAVGGTGNGGAAMPRLLVTTAGGPRDLPDLSLFSGGFTHQATGYVMIAAGAFAAISADSMLSTFETIAGSSDAMQRLAQVAWVPDNVGQKDGRLLRKLNNIHDTGRSGVFEGIGLNTDPVEVLHVRVIGGGAGDIS